MQSRSIVIKFPFFFTLPLQVRCGQNVKLKFDVSGTQSNTKPAWNAINFTCELFPGQLCNTIASDSDSSANTASIDAPLTVAEASAQRRPEYSSKLLREPSEVSSAPLPAPSAAVSAKSLGQYANEASTSAKAAISDASTAASIIGEDLSSPLIGTAKAPSPATSTSRALQTSAGMSAPPTSAPASVTPREAPELSGAIAPQTLGSSRVTSTYSVEYQVKGMSCVWP